MSDLRITGSISSQSAVTQWP